MVYVRQDAGRRLEETVRRLGAEGVVVSAMTLSALASHRRGRGRVQRLQVRVGTDLAQRPGAGRPAPGRGSLRVGSWKCLGRPPVAVVASRRTKTTEEVDTRWNEPEGSAPTLRSASPLC